MPQHLGHPRHATTDSAGSGASAKATDADKVRQAMDEVLTSPEFEGAQRLQSFLSYVVEEALAGRGDGIMAKTIAEDVYHRPLDRGNDPHAVVRVDAGRLRRKLDTYYGGSGQNAKLRIHIDPGGYCPRFEFVPTDVPSNSTTGPQYRVERIAIAALAGLATAGAAALWLWNRNHPDTTSGAVREALLAVSPPRLQAVNLAEEARDLMFPVMDIHRLSAVLDLFSQATQLDGSYFGGHAGAAQVKAILALSARDEDQRSALISSGRAHAAKAVELAPEQGWSHSARAMVEFVDRDFDTALETSSRAVRLGPDDPHVVRFDALIALFSGKFEHALAQANTLARISGSENRGIHRNVMSAAHYHLGNYETSLGIHIEAIRAGDPVSPINLTFVAAAQARLDRPDRARETLKLIQKSWPDVRTEAFLRRVYDHPEDADDLFLPLHAISQE